MFVIWDSRQQDWQLFWLSFEHWPQWVNKWILINPSMQLGYSVQTESIPSILMTWLLVLQDINTRVLCKEPGAGLKILVKLTCTISIKKKNLVSGKSWGTINFNPLHTGNYTVNWFNKWHWLMPWHWYRTHIIFKTKFAINKSFPTNCCSISY